MKKIGLIKEIVAEVWANKEKKHVRFTSIYKELQAKNVDLSHQINAESPPSQLFLLLQQEDIFFSH